MNVQSLIEQLQSFPQNAVVCGCDNEEGYYEISQIQQEPLEDSPYVTNSTEHKEAGCMVVML